MTSASKTDRLTALLRRYPSAERLVLLRNFAFGGAAACAAAILAVTQVGATKLELQIAVVSAAFGIPAWICLGGLYEYYIYLGPRSYAHLRQQSTTSFFSVMMITAGLALVGAFGGVIWYLSKTAFGVFVIASVIGTLVFSGFHVFLARWWFGADGPGAKDEQ